MRSGILKSLLRVFLYIFSYEFLYEREGMLFNIILTVIYDRILGE